MPTGRIKWFSDTKGYGFIQPDAGGDDVFVHLSELRRSTPPIMGVSEGQKVSFELSTNSRSGKSAASNIAIIRPGAL
jgi:CspA family cold shock protein